MNPIDLRTGHSWVAAASAGYLTLMWTVGHLGWQHTALVLLVWAALTPQAGPRRFLSDWWPMILFWLGYDFMRIFADRLAMRAAVEDPLRWEQALFPAPGGNIWPFYFTGRIASAQAEGWRLLAVYCELVYLSHLFAVPVLMIILWARRSCLFPRLLWPLTVLHVAAFVVYLAYPAAPPWWVYENGLLQPTLGRSLPVGLESSSILSRLFHLSPNRFAAIPSVHAAYPMVLVLVLARAGAPRWAACAAAAYTASMWFACVFLNQHYIVDLVLGAVLALAALPAGERLLRRLNRTPSSDG